MTWAQDQSRLGWLVEALSLSALVCSTWLTWRIADGEERLHVNVTRWIEQHPLLVFFVLAYVISWVILAPLAILGERAASVYLPLVVMSAFGPALAALVVTRVTEGRDGVRRWASRFARWRVPVGWYLAAFLMPFLLALAGYGLYLLLGGSPTVDRQWPSPLLFLATVLFIFFLGGGQEEAGWRGFALPRLQARYSALSSSLILGVIWALSHLPTFFLSRQGEIRHHQS